MATVNQVINKKIKLILSQARIGAEDILAKRIKDKLVEKIESNFYQRYNVGSQKWLIKAITVEIKLIRERIDIFVYFDNQSLAHTSWWGSTELGINAGEKVYTPYWINSGKTFDPTTRRRMEEVGGVEFMQDTIKELKLEKAWIQEFYNYMKKLK